MILPKKFFFQNIKIKLNSIPWMTLKSSVVIFQALELLQAHWPHRPLQPHWPLQPQKPHFTKNFLILMVGSSLAPKWPILAPFCGMDHQKSNFSLISDTLSVRGCWGQPMSFFWKLVDETQISKPLEATRHHKSKKYWSFYLSEPFSFDHFTLIHPVFCHTSYMLIKFQKRKCWKNFPTFWK